MLHQTVDEYPNEIAVSSLFADVRSAISVDLTELLILFPQSMLASSTVTTRIA